jgi:hypothetical protein
MTLAEGGEAFGQWDQGEELAHGGNRRGGGDRWPLRRDRERNGGGSGDRLNAWLRKVMEGGTGRRLPQVAERAPGERRGAVVPAMAVGMDMTRVRCAIGV